MTIWLWNLGAYSVQLAVLALTAAAVTALLRLHTPRVTLRFWQLLLAVALVLPFLQPWTTNPSETIQSSITFVSSAVIDNAPAVTERDPMTLIAAILIAGVIIRLSWLGFGLLRLRAIRRRAVPATSLDDVSGELRHSLQAGADVMFSDEVDGPATVGWWRAVVLVPRRVTELSPAAQRAVLCHELIHVRRRDWLATVLEEIWCAALWFHPGARLMTSRACLAREMLVDELAIQHTRDRRAYAEALLAFSNPQRHLIGATALIGRRQLSQRISLIAQEVSMSRNRVASLLVLSAAIVAAATLSAASSIQMVGAFQAQDTTVYKPGSGITLPVVLKEVKPDYPKDVMNGEKVQGSVWMRCVVMPDGKIGDIEVTRSLHPRLDDEARRAARQWEFKPGTKDGKPVAVEITLEFTFSLK
jgi:TonB family protein